MSIAKLLVVGAGEAGKSTLIRMLAPDSMNLEVNGRTVAMDHAVLVRDGSRLSIVGVPGQGRFEAVREVLATGSHGVLWIHRAGHPIDLPSAEMVRRLAARGAPFMVIVNHDRAQREVDGWACPPGLPPPCNVLSGDLLSPSTCRDRILDAIWSMMDERSTPT